MNRTVTLVSFSIQYADSIPQHDVLFIGGFFFPIFQISLMMTIIGLAQNFVGSNNLNLLQPLGQFGTRLHGGKDSASPRYIFTMLR